jgi:hypothetical protein
VRTTRLEVVDSETGNTGSWIDSDGVGYFRGMHTMDEFGGPMTSFNEDGSMVMRLNNGNLLIISPEGGFIIMDPRNPTNPVLAHINAVGQSMFQGAKSAIVPTPSYGVRRMYVEEATEIWFRDRGQGTLENGALRIELEPMFLEMVTIDDNNPMIVKITPTAECNGLFVAEKHDTGFVVKELMQGRSNASFDWEVSIRRRGHEDVRMNPFDAPPMGRTK